MDPLVPCPLCARHLRASARACPFCAAPLDAAAAAVPTSASLPRGLTRSAIASFRASILAAGAVAASADLGGCVVHYGGPPPEPPTQDTAIRDDDGTAQPDREANFTEPTEPDPGAPVAAYGAPPP